MFSGKKVLLTGGAGFIGSNLARRLIAEGAELTILDDFSTGSLGNLVGIEGQYELVWGNVCSLPFVGYVTRDKDYVFHLAVMNIIVSTDNPLTDFDVNAGGTLNVLSAAREHGVGRVVYTSSSSIYGNATVLPIYEDREPELLSPYAASKYVGEIYCSVFWKNYSVPSVTLRLTNTYGPGQNPDNPYCGVVSRFMQRAMDGKPCQIYGDGIQTRDYVYIDDVIDAIITAALSPKVVGEVFNIGTGVGCGVNMLAKKICGIAGSDLAPEYISPRPIDSITRRVLAIGKASGGLGWTPHMTLDGGLRKTWKWLKEKNQEV